MPNFEPNARHLPTVFLFLLGAVLLSACGDDTGDDSPTGDDCDHSVSLPDAAIPEDSGSLAGIDTTPEPGCTGTWVAGMMGSITDLEQSPVPGARPQMCIRRAESGFLQCLAPPVAGTDGSFQIVVNNDEDRCMDQAALRVFLAGNNVTLYCELSLTEGILNGGVFPLSGTCPAPMLPPEGDSTTMRTVTFEDGLEVDVVPDEIGFTGDYSKLASAHFVPSELAGNCILDHAPDFVGAYAFSPEADIEGDGFATRLPNHYGLAAGSQVELYVLGGLNTTVGSDMIAEAEWVLASTATVSADGSTLEGGQLPAFTWLGIRAL